MRTAVVTGASRGIGNAIAAELSRRGWKLFLTAQHDAGLVKASQSLQGVVGTAAVDVSNGATSAKSIADAVRKKMSALDLLVLSAGIFIEDSLGDVSESSFERNLAVNLNANVFLVKQLLPLLRAGTKPRIVIIGSTAAYEPYPLVPTYGIAKWGLRGYAVNLRHELIPDRIGVTFLSPGGTLTDMWAGEQVEANRLLEPGDIARLTATLTELSEQAVVDEIIIRPILGDIHE